MTHQALIARRDDVAPARRDLAARRRVDIPDLKGDRIALWAPPGQSYYSEFLVGACRRAGSNPITW